MQIIDCFNSPKTTEMPPTWLRGLALSDKSGYLVATGVVFPDGRLVLRWSNNGVLVVYESDQAATEALGAAEYIFRVHDIRI